MLTIEELELLLKLCQTHHISVEMFVNESLANARTTQLDEIERKLELMMQTQGSG